MAEAIYYTHDGAGYAYPGCPIHDAQGTQSRPAPAGMPIAGAPARVPADGRARGYHCPECRKEPADATP